MADRNGNNCRLLWATDRAEANRLRPMMNVVTRQSACEKRGKPGFLIAGQCLNVSRAKVIEHEETIQRKRAAAHTDCRAKGRDTLQETVTWKGQFEYVCDFRGREDDDDSNIACDPGNVSIHPRCLAANASNHPVALAVRASAERRDALDCTQNLRAVRLPFFCALQIFTLPKKSLIW
jgi:hypothetical protein